jgi:hypothetical protein
MQFRQQGSGVLMAEDTTSTVEVALETVSATTGETAPLVNARPRAIGTNPMIENTPSPNRPAQVSQIAGGQTFADFMYAVVIGVAFSDIKLGDSWPVLLATIVLLLMVLEDFFMYQTQVKPQVGVFRFWTLRSLFFEVGMLLSWFLSFLSRKESLRGAIVCIGLFFFLKWLASALRISTTEKSKRWVLHRDHFYLMTVLCAIVLAFLYPNFFGTYIILGAVWLIQTFLWWLVVKIHERGAQETTR